MTELFSANKKKCGGALSWYTLVLLLCTNESVMDLIPVWLNIVSPELQ